MKNLASILLCFITTTSFAQNGFYLAPEIGVGYTNSRVNSTVINGWGGIYDIGKPEGFATYTGQLGIGYHFNKWNLTSDISLIKSGYTIGYATADFTVVHITEIRNDYHLSVPVVLSYQFNIGKHFFLAPGVGGALSYNYSERLIAKELLYSSDQETVVHNELLKGSKFEQEHHLVSLWAAAQAQAGYTVSQRLSVVAGPQIQAMLTSLVNKNDADQKNYVVSFNTGVVWRLKDSKSLKNTTE